ncbi:hypothetical protein OAO87_04410 [bacterium]|nr:hypothetical protein [bacterium]
MAKGVSGRIFGTCAPRRELPRCSLRTISRKTRTTASAGWAVTTRCTAKRRISSLEQQWPRPGAHTPSAAHQARRQQVQPHPGAPPGDAGWSHFYGQAMQHAQQMEQQQLLLLLMQQQPQHGAVGGQHMLPGVPAGGCGGYAPSAVCGGRT